MESTAIVTGGSRGLGRAYCVALAAAGFNVVVADLLDTQEAVGDIEAAGGRAIGVHADISSAADNDALAAATVDAFGTIDVLINNAAYFSETTRGPFWSSADPIIPDSAEDSAERFVGLVLADSAYPSGEALHAFAATGYDTAVNPNQTPSRASQAASPETT